MTIDELVAELAFYDELATTSNRISGPLILGDYTQEDRRLIGHIGLVRTKTMSKLRTRLSGPLWNGVCF